MGYRSLKECVTDLEKTGQLVRVRAEIDPYLEAAEIHRRIYQSGGPAILFEHLKDTRFPALSNLYGTYERTKFLLRKTFPRVEKLIRLKADPTLVLKHPGQGLQAATIALKGLPRRTSNCPVAYSTCELSDLPSIVSWPEDGGGFITLPQVLTLPPGSRKMMESNLGMYRIQLDGNDYAPGKEAGMHYQLHRGIGIHHRQYLSSEEPFRASVFIGGPPSHAFAAIMPLPEGLSELSFAGMLANRRFRYTKRNNYILSCDADFCLTGIISKREKKKEGPFGDHLGYYSLAHDFPVFQVEKVYHRKDAIWHFTVVGRPPQEDSNFGRLIHDLVEPLLSSEFPGIKEVNAVDAAGVHPLLIAIGSERYMPFREKKPEEIITQANHLLGKGQTSLAKYLIIADGNDAPELTVHDIPAFFQFVLERLDWRRDLHFQTNTTIDTLDYSGTGWNAGSKVVIACAGEKQRNLSHQLPAEFNLPDPFSDARFVLPGILAIKSPDFESQENAQAVVSRLADHLKNTNTDGIMIIVLTEDVQFIAAHLNNFLWVTFTRSNPSHDIYGVNSFIEFKHWGCSGPLIIDARVKPHHAPQLISDPAVSKKVDSYFQKGGILEGLD